MTLPAVIMLISGLLWFGFSAARANSGGHWLYDWAVDVCRIVFAASVLVVLWGKMTERVF